MVGILLLYFIWTENSLLHKWSEPIFDFEKFLLSDYK